MPLPARRCEGWGMGRSSLATRGHVGHRATRETAAREHSGSICCTGVPATSGMTVSVSTLCGSGNFFEMAQKPPIGWRLTVSAGELGSRLSGGAGPPLSSGAYLCAAPCAPL
eukprot:1595057-Prymnesium_polylepis.2